MPSLRLHQRRIPLLWVLVGLNLIFAAAVPWVLMGMAPRSPFPGPQLGPEVMGTLVFLAAEILLLSVWTGLYDPRLPVRWLAIAAVLIVAGVVFAGDFNLLLKAFYPQLNGRLWFEYRYILVISTAIAFVVMGFIIVLLSHCVLWLVRSLSGIRIGMSNQLGEMPKPQFGVAQGLLWIGLVSALFGLSRAFSGQDWFLAAAIVGAMVTLVAALLIVSCLAFFGQSSC